MNMKRSWIRLCALSSLLFALLTQSAVWASSAIAVGSYNSNIAPALAGAGSASVVVQINRVRRIDPMDSPPDVQADFYAQVLIDGVESTSPVSESRDDITPQWSFSREARGESVQITIKLFDKDEGGSDDHCDINPRVKEKDIRVNYNLRTGHITGDVTGLAQKLIRVHGAGPDTKKAEIWFTVYQR